MRHEDFANLVNSVCNKHPLLTTSFVKSMTKNERLHLCVAAKNRSKRTNLSFKDDQVEKAQIYYIELDGEKEERPVIKCPTSPLMFVYFENLRINEDVHVMIIRTDVGKTGV